jgi:ABC-type bacteriocin/lantibiotic exporter with double-glycine peptidase domain
MGFLIRFGRHFLSIQSFYLKIINWKRYVISKKFHDDLISEFSYEESTNNKKKIENIENIEIQNLSISYNNEKIIQNFNLSLKNNFFIKIYGDNGSGKTTLARSMLGLIKLNEGQIKYNDIKLNEIDKISISQKITILDKNPLIIEGSILDNIKISSDNKDIDKKELLNLISLLNLEKLFNENNLQKKIIEENGKNLSQGQIQKISLLRSLMNKYEILIIDEGTSNIDINDEKKIIDHLFNLYKNKKLNIIFISHSSTYDNMFNQKIILRNEKYD